MSVLKEDLQPLLQKAFFYLKFRRRSKKEIEQYLFKKIESSHWSTDDVTKVVNHLEDLDYINDKKFIELFVEQRNLLKPKGKKALMQELIQHGIDKELIEEYFLTNPIDEESMAKNLLIKRVKHYSKIDKKKRFEKVAAFLLRRGFNYGVVKKVVGDIYKNN